MENEGQLRMNSGAWTAARGVWALALLLCLLTLIQSLIVFNDNMKRGAMGYTYDWGEGPAGVQIQVTQVFPGSAADSAGLQPGDIISALDGQTVQDPETFFQAGGNAVGSGYTLTVQRAGQEHSIALIRRAGWWEPFSMGWISLTGLPLGFLIPFGLATVIIFWLIFIAAAVWVLRTGQGQVFPFVLSLTLLFVGAGMPANEVSHGHFAGSLGLLLDLVSYTIPYGLIFLTLLLVPDGRFSPRWTALLALVFPLLVQFMPGFVLLLVTVAVFLVIGVVVVVRRMPQLDAAARRKSLLILAGAAALFVGLFAISAISAIAPSAYRFTESIGFTLQLLISLAFPWCAWQVMKAA